ncbi:hypothetical protein GIB67_016530 [Kingdonia uniflora]|uniref:DNA-directed DNA polymerase n=1 Tax=Kingdonia uniflora TaxID=39325 RepID=A0A7J7NQN5_9MAGN|nr:hypothetical protein GIB67_016530 [Kingdonia uniflora]
MNSLCGRFCINHESTITEICKRDKYAEITQREKIIMGNKLSSDYYIVSYIGTVGYVKDSDWSPPKNSTVQISATITAYAQIYMYQFTSRDDCYYTDTDSTILGKLLSEEYVSSKVLGLLKLECFIKEGIFLAPKCYKLITEDDQKIIKHKGPAKNYVNANWFNSQYIKPSTTQNISVESNFKIDWENFNIDGSHTDVRGGYGGIVKNYGGTVFCAYHEKQTMKADFIASFSSIEGERMVYPSSMPIELHIFVKDDAPCSSSKPKIRLRFSLLRHVVGKNSTKFMSHFVKLVREHIPPYYPSWLAVPLRLKDTIWETICDEYVLPQAAKRKLMKSANTMWRNGKKYLGKRRKGVFRVADEMMEMDPTIMRSDSFLVGHTRSDGTFPTAFVEEKVIAVKDIITKNPQSKYLDVDHDPLAQVFGPVKKGCVNFTGPDVTKKFIQSTELLRAHITEDKESYIDLENRFSQYKAENDARFLRLFCEKRQLFIFLNFHEHIVATGRALVLPGLQESEDAEYEVIVDIIFEEISPVFGQRGVFFDERLIGMKIKYPRILLRFAY